MVTQCCQGFVFFSEGLIPTEGSTEMFAAMVLKGAPDKSLQTNDIMFYTAVCRKRSNVPRWEQKKKKKKKQHSLESKEVLNLTQVHS